MDKRDIGIALKRLRERKFTDEQSLFSATGIYPATIKSTEAGTNLPNILIIEKWVIACGSTLTEFFKQFESVPAESSDVRIIHGYEPFYRLLTQIIESDQKFFIDGIHANLVAMARSANDAVHKTPSEEGNLLRKERKRAGRRK